MTDRVATDQDDWPGVLVLRLPENFQTGPDCVRPFLDAPLNEGQVRIAVDMSGLDFLSSSGLSYILRSTRRARDLGGDIRMFALARFVRRTFTELGLLGPKGIAVYKSEEEAVRSFRE